MSQGVSIRLRPWLVMVFVCLVVPVFGAVLAFNYITAERVAREAASRLVERSLHEAGSRTRELIDPMRTMVDAAAGLAAAQPDFLRGSAGFAFLENLLSYSDSVAGVFAGFSDGTFRGVLKTRAGSLVQGVEAPAMAYLARLSRDPQPDVLSSQTIEFIAQDGRVLETRQVPGGFDPRTRPWYRGAAAAGARTLSDPYVFASTSETGVTVAAPFGAAGAPAGVVGADLTLAAIAQHMRDRRVSANAQSFLVDERDQILAHGQSASGRRAASAPGALPVFGAGEKAVSALSTGRQSAGQLVFMNDTSDGGPVAAITLDLSDSLGKPWALLAMAPLSDFSGALHDNNRRILLLGLAALVIQILLIIGLSRAMAVPLERLAARVDQIRALRCEPPSVAEPSVVHEISALGKAVSTLQATVNSFSAYVPRDLVKQLVDSGQALTLGGQSRYLTLMFTDLEGFSQLSERLPTQTLLKQVSAYLSLVTEVVEAERGTVDKFIGDGAMAFWGAPTEVPDHAWHACVAAVRIQKGLAALNLQWLAEGLEPLKVRIGVHTDSVLVGNIGSTNRMSYTVLGDGVNVAAYLELANKAFDTAICVSQSVVREAGHRLCVRPLDQMSVKSRQSAIVVFELMGILDSDPVIAPDPDAAMLARLGAEAWRARQQGLPHVAQETYRQSIARYPEDPVSQRLLERVG